MGVIGNGRLEFGVILSALALAAAGQANKGSAVAGLVLSGMAVVLGIMRLIVGGGVV